MGKQLRKCPFCGSDRGMYSKYSLHDVYMFYDFNGHVPEENLDYAYRRGGKNLYCASCGRYICRKADYAELFPAEKPGKTERRDGGNTGQNDVKKKTQGAAHIPGSDGLHDCHARDRMGRQLKGRDTGS